VYSFTFKQLHLPEETSLSKASSVLAIKQICS
jgi:hypothetical protein